MRLAATLPICLANRKARPKVLAELPVEWRGSKFFVGGVEGLEGAAPFGVAGK